MNNNDDFVMHNTISANRRKVAHNTFLLYIRMFVVMGIGLYIGRIILDTLGEIDYGIYNVVGGVITVSSFLLSAISAASQRFISFELGRGETDRLRNVFCSSVNIHSFSNYHSPNKIRIRSDLFLRNAKKFILGDIFVIFACVNVDNVKTYVVITSNYFTSYSHSLTSSNSFFTKDFKDLIE